MAAAAVSAAPTQGSGTGAGGGSAQNPFQIATNLYAEKNLQGLITGQAASASSQQFGGSVNAGQYLRGVHIIVRSTNTAATVTVPTDGAFAILQNADLTNVDGSEILYNMSGVAHYLAQKYSKPWLADRVSAYDYTPITTSSGGSFSLFLQPEIRFTAGVLANTDTRSQYRLDYTMAPMTAGTQPQYNITPYMDAWAQPDAQDLQGTPNQPVPPGVNLQVKRRHQIFTLNPGADNTMLSTLTGNAIRNALLITRNASGVRINSFTDPIYWYLDNRSLGRLNPDILRQWAEDQYNTYGLAGRSATAPSAQFATINNAVDGQASNGGNYAGNGSEDTGVYAFPRFMNPGDLYGQGWLYTANSTKLAWEATAISGSATCELVCDEVYPVGNVDPTLVDI